MAENLSLNNEEEKETDEREINKNANLILKNVERFFGILTSGLELMLMERSFCMDQAKHFLSEDPDIVNKRLHEVSVEILERLLHHFYEINSDDMKAISAGDREVIREHIKVKRQEIYPIS